MSDERILEIIENHDKHYILGFIKGIKLNICELQQENAEIKNNYERIYNENCELRKKHNITDISLLDENEKLKTQLEELKIHNPNYTPVVTLKETIKHLYTEQAQLLNQQKEFIKYMEDEITKLEKVQVSSLEEITGKDYLIKVKKEILSKYKEIIGDVEDE